METLFSYHRQSIEVWLSDDLFSHSGTRAEDFRRIIVSATLVDFPQFRDIHHLIPQALDLRSTYIRTHNRTEHYYQIEDSDKWEIYFKYRKIVSRFLKTALWSKGQEHWEYVSLAKYLLSSLSF